MSTEKSQTFFVDGMHCASCTLYLEETLQGQSGVIGVRADLNTCAVTVTGDFTDEPQVLAEALTALVVDNGYRLSVERLVVKANYRDFIVAVPAALAFIVAFVLLQEFGFVNLLNTSSMSFGTAVLIGLVASVSTCLAVVGGLVLSISANAVKNNTHRRAQVMFHLGRFGGFFVLGGVIGSLGKLFELGLVGSAVLGMVVAVVMLILGLNLLDVFAATKKMQLKMPSIFAHQAGRLNRSSHWLAPLAVGVATFFLPCGFTQSMQVYTLTTGSFVTGGLTMLFFALGTFPVLALLSFGVLEIANKPWKGIFFKASGLVVITLALFNLFNVLRSLNLF